MSDPLPPPGVAERSLVGWDLAKGYFEAFHPWLMGGVVFFFVYRANISDAQFKEVVERVLPPTISVSSVLAGFQGAGQAVLLSSLHSGTIEFLKRTGHYKRLVSYLWRAIFTLMFTVAASLVVVFLVASGKPAWLHNAPTLAVLSGLFASAAAASYRINRLMFRILLLENAGAGRPPACLIDERDEVKKR
jgi:hypothetical protein